MKNSIFICSAFVATLTFGGSGQASDTMLSDLYIKGEVGASISQDTGKTSFQDQFGGSAEFANNDLGTASVLGVGFGKELSGKIRADLTLNFRHGHEFDAKTLPISGIPILPVPTTANLQSYGLMANIFYDIATLTVGKKSIVPYLGGGVGFAVNKLDTVTFNYAAVTSFSDVTWAGDKKTNFAWQVGGGFGVDLSENSTLEIGYRYVDLGKFQSGTQILSGASGQLQRRLKGDISAHEVTIGLRYNF